MSDAQIPFNFNQPRQRRPRRPRELPAREPPTTSAPESRTVQPLAWVHSHAWPYLRQLPGRSVDKAVLDVCAWVIIIAVLAFLAFIGIRIGVIPWWSKPEPHLEMPGKKDQPRAPPAPKLEAPGKDQPVPAPQKDPWEGEVRKG